MNLNLYVYTYICIYIYAAHGAAWKWLHGKIFIYAGGRLMGLHSEAKQLRHDVFLNAGRDKYRCHSPANTRGFALPCTLGPVSFGVSSSSGNEILPPCPKSKLVAEEKNLHRFAQLQWPCQVLTQKHIILRNGATTALDSSAHLARISWKQRCQVGIILLLARQRSSKIEILEGFKVVLPHFSQHKVTKFSFGASGPWIKAM